MESDSSMIRIAAIFHIIKEFMEAHLADDGSEDDLFLADGKMRR